MSAIIISAYPACGKTTYFNKHSKYAKGKGTRKILDSDSSKFSWVYDEDGNKTDERNPNFPNNYIEHIKENLDKQEIIFISTHDAVREALEKENIPYVVIYPSHDMKSIFLKRMKERGNDEKFIKDQDKHWSKRISALDKSKYPKKFKLTRNHQYIDDDLIKQIKIVLERGW